MNHQMQCAKCFRVCRLSSTGKTWVCTICKHREKANGGQAVSDKLPHVEVHEAMCKSIGDMAKENEALKDRIKRLEEALSFVTVDCGNLHHGKKHRHKYGEPCPVVELIEKAKEAKL